MGSAQQPGSSAWLQLPAPPSQFWLHKCVLGDLPCPHKMESLRVISLCLWSYVMLKEGMQKNVIPDYRYDSMWHETHPSQEWICSVMISTSFLWATSHGTACPAKSAPRTYVIACITVCMRVFVINGYVSCRLQLLVKVMIIVRWLPWYLCNVL